MSDDLEADTGVPAAAQRLDKWLWFVRVIKTRTQAAQLVTDGKVRVNRQRIAKPSQAIRPGDVVTVAVRGRIRVLRVVAGGVRRGPPSEAQTLFEDLSDTRVAAERESVDTARATGESEAPAASSAQHQSGSRPRGSGRPTKRDRRLTDQLKEV